MYKTPFTITNKMLNLVILITKNISKIDNYSSLKRMPVLRKNKIKSIYSSLTIKNNSSSLDQIKDTINGKIIFG